LNVIWPKGATITSLGQENEKGNDYERERNKCFEKCRGPRFDEVFAELNQNFAFVTFNSEMTSKPFQPTPKGV
jgi:hypothetical protein